jgi:hypothetical protein
MKKVDKDLLVPPSAIWLILVNTSAANLGQRDAKDNQRILCH